MSGLSAKARPVDRRLGVLNSIADREWLGFNMDAMVEQHLKAISGTVSYRQNNMATVQCIAIVQADAGNLSFGILSTVLT